MTDTMGSHSRIPKSVSQFPFLIHTPSLKDCVYFTLTTIQDFSFLPPKLHALRLQFLQISLV